MGFTAVALVLFNVTGLPSAALDTPTAARVETIRDAGGDVELTTIAGVTTVRSVTLRKRRLDRSVLEAVAGCEELRRLVIADCDVSRPHLRLIERLRSIEELLLLGMKADEPTAVWALQLPALKSLMFGLKGEYRANLRAALPQLEEAIVFSRSLSDTTVASLLRSRALSFANLVHSRAGAETFRQAAGHPALAEVLAGATSMNDDDLCHVLQAPRLTTLSVRYCRVGDRGVRFAKLAKNLTWLDLGYTRLSDVGVAAVAMCPALETIGLDGVAVSDSALQHLVLHSSVSSIWLHHTKVRPPGRLPSFGPPRTIRMLLPSGKLAECIAEPMQEMNDRDCQQAEAQNSQNHGPTSRDHPGPR